MPGFEFCEGVGWVFAGIEALDQLSPFFGKERNGLEGSVEFFNRLLNLFGADGRNIHHKVVLKAKAPGENSGNNNGHKNIRNSMCDSL